jgi:hypothetical protein
MNLGATTRHTRLAPESLRSILTRDHELVSCLHDRRWGMRRIIVFLGLVVLCGCIDHSADLRTQAEQERQFMRVSIIARI